MQLVHLLRSLPSRPLLQKKTILLLGVLLVCVVTWRHERPIPTFDRYQEPQQHPILLLWWDYPMSYNDYTRWCGPHKCTFTTSHEKVAAAKALLFYGPFLKNKIFPLPRLPYHVWALMYEESPHNEPFITDELILQHFNFTSTFSRYSDYPLTTLHLPDAEQLTSTTYVVPVDQKTALQRRENLAPIAFLQTNCDTRSGREVYVSELMRHVTIDSLGGCLHNRDLPASLNIANKPFNRTSRSQELHRLLARYKFIIAYENSVCYDYITEKFWRPLIVGSIPIYFGSPTIKDWEPNPKSAVYISDFPSPEALANFIRKLDDNDTEYNSYLNHKYDQLEPISNQRLQHELLTRNFSLEDPDLIHHFECFVCGRLQEMNPRRTYMATVKHYECPSLLAYPPIGSGSYPREHWSSVAAASRCQAGILDRLLRRNAKYTRHDFEVLLNHEMHEKKCH